MNEYISTERYRVIRYMPGTHVPFLLEEVPKTADRGAYALILVAGQYVAVFAGQYLIFRGEETSAFKVERSLIDYKPV